MIRDETKAAVDRIMADIQKEAEALYGPLSSEESVQRIRRELRAKIYALFLKQAHVVGKAGPRSEF
jgi:hypothetical protein